MTTGVGGNWGQYHTTHLKENWHAWRMMFGGLGAPAFSPFNITVLTYRALFISSKDAKYIVLPWNVFFIIDNHNCAYIIHIDKHAYIETRLHSV